MTGILKKVLTSAWRQGGLAVSVVGTVVALGLLFVVCSFGPNNRDDAPAGEVMGFRISGVHFGVTRELSQECSPDGSPVRGPRATRPLVAPAITTERLMQELDEQAVALGWSRTRRLPDGDEAVSAYRKNGWRDTLEIRVRADGAGASGFVTAEGFPSC
jgi:hypothetical protein